MEKKRQGQCVTGRLNRIISEVWWMKADNSKGVIRDNFKAAKREDVEKMKRMHYVRLT